MHHRANPAVPVRLTSEDLLAIAEQTGVLVCWAESRAEIWRVWRERCRAARRAHVAIRLMPRFVQLEVNLVDGRLGPAAVAELAPLAASGPRLHRGLPPIVGASTASFRVRGDGMRVLRAALRIARGEGVQLGGAP